MAVSFGSSLQVALFVAPVLVLLGVDPRPADGPRVHPARGRRGRRRGRHQRADRARRRVELARGRAPDARLPHPRDLVLRAAVPLEAVAVRRAATAREGDARRRRGRARSESGRGTLSSPRPRPRPRRSRASRRRPAIGSVGRALAVPLGLGDQRIRPPAAPRNPSCAVPRASRRGMRRSRSSSVACPRSSSHDRVCSRPSTATCWPLPRYVPAISASRSQVTTFEYSAFSRPPLRYSLLATVKVVTFFPLARLRISGSRVRRPVRKTLFTVGSPSRSAGCSGPDPALRRVQADASRGSCTRTYRPLARGSIASEAGRRGYLPAAPAGDRRGSARG